jgi:hypothetical protein
MARNKRNESALRPGPLLTSLSLCALFVLLGVGYVWYKNQIDVLGHQIKEREIRLADLERENQVRRDQLATLCSPVALDGLVKKLKLGLVPPAKSQVIWMTETPAGTQTAGVVSADQRRAEAVVAERKY